MPDHRPADPDAPLNGAADIVSDAAPETLADLGEWELIRRLGAFAPAGQFGDDAALLPLSDATTGRATADRGPSTTAGRLVVNTDVLVDGVHFSDATMTPADVGWRATAANLSDLAAMGCTQGMGITVGLVAPADTPWSWVEGVYQGIGEALQAHGGVLLGGDCSSGAQRLLAITAVGRLPSEGGPIRRGDGRPGDLLVCTGPHGLSRLGLALLQAQQQDEPRGGRDADHTNRLGPLDKALSQRAIRTHQRPIPRFDAVRVLIACRPKALSWRVGGCDSSDGLAAAATAIAAASGCTARLDRQRLPLDPVMAPLPEAESWCLGGGEDFELVLALDPAWARALLRALPGCSTIGTLTTGTAGTLSWSDDDAGTAPSGMGFQHFH